MGCWWSRGTRASRWTRGLRFISASRWTWASRYTRGRRWNSFIHIRGKKNNFCNIWLKSWRVKFILFCKYGGGGVKERQIKRMCYYPHRSRDSVSPVCGIFFLSMILNTVISSVHQEPSRPKWLPFELICEAYTEYIVTSYFVRSAPTLLT